MKVPSNPQKGYSIAAKISEILRFLKADRIVSVIGGKLMEGPNGKVLVIDKPAPKAPKANELLPFQWFKSTAGFIDYKPGILQGDSFSGSPQAVTITGDEIWYLYVEVNFNTTTGAVTSKDVYWSTSNLVSDYDAGVAYEFIAQVTIVGGVIDSGLSFNYNYGPISFIIAGGLNSKWEVYFI